MELLMPIYMPRFALFTLLSALLFNVLAVPNTAQAHDWKTPEDAINAYIKAVKTGSGEHIKMAFTESASIQFYDDIGEYLSYSRDEFAELVDSGGDWDAKIEITDLKKTGRAANATVEFTWDGTVDGKKAKKGYVDYLNLIYDNKKSWHITDKVAQYVDR